MMGNDADTVVVRLPEKREGETRAHHQGRVQQWRARKGWRVQIDAQQAAQQPAGEQDDRGVA